MISSIQNRQQNTAFGAKIFPNYVMEGLRYSGNSPKTLSDIAKDIFNKTHCQGAGTILANPEKLALTQGKVGHNVVPSKKELKVLEGIQKKFVSYDLADKGFSELQKLLETAKPATSKDIEAIKLKAKQKAKPKSKQTTLTKKYN